MNDPSYDFFGSGTTSTPATPAPPGLVAPAVAPVRPAAPAAPQQATYATPTGRVNQFGTPVGAPATPTGPVAAAGIGAAPTSLPGMVTTWQGPPMQARAAARAAPATGLPRNVRAVAILALFFGVLLGLWTAYGFSQYSTLSALVDQLSTAQSTGANGTITAFSSSAAHAMLAAVMLLLVLMSAVTVILLLGGAATLADRTWGGWLLVVAYGLYVLSELYAFTHDGYTLWGAIGVAIAVVLLLVLVTGDGLRWLLSR